MAQSSFLMPVIWPQRMLVQYLEDGLAHRFQPFFMDEACLHRHKDVGIRHIHAIDQLSFLHAHRQLELIAVMQLRGTGLHRRDQLRIDLRVFDQ